MRKTKPGFFLDPIQKQDMHKNFSNDRISHLERENEMLRDELERAREEMQKLREENMHLKEQVVKDPAKLQQKRNGE